MMVRMRPQRGVKGILASHFSHRGFTSRYLATYKLTVVKIVIHKIVINLDIASNDIASNIAKACPNTFKIAYKSEEVVSNGSRLHKMESIQSLANC